MSPTKAPMRPPTARGHAARGRAVRPAVDPRIQRRRADVTRRAGRRRLVVLSCLLALAAAGCGAWGLLHCSWLSARVVHVVGSTETPASVVEQAGGVSRHPPLVDVDAGAVAARVERLPWVCGAAVHPEWPDGLLILVTQCTPVAALDVTAAAAPASAAPIGEKRTVTPTPVGAGQQWVVVDGAGRVLEDVSTPPVGLMRIAAPGIPGVPGTVVSGADAAGVKVAASLPKAFSSQVTGVDVVCGDTVTLTMSTPITVDLGTATHLHEKYEDVAAILAGASLVDGDVIDVHVWGAPTVGPSKPGCPS